MLENYSHPPEPSLIVGGVRGKHGSASSPLRWENLDVSALRDPQEVLQESAPLPPLLTHSTTPHYRLPSLPSLLPQFPKITSQISDLHSNSCLRLCFRGTQRKATAVHSFLLIPSSQDQHFFQLGSDPGVVSLCVTCQTALTPAIGSQCPGLVQTFWTLLTGLVSKPFSS